MRTLNGGQQMHCVGYVETMFSVLPQNQSGSIVIGTIHPSFIVLLPLAREKYPGVQVYRKRGLKENNITLQNGIWKDNEWPLNA